MSRIKRRHFLQSAGSMLAAIGLSQSDFFRQGDRVGRVLAQNTPRKLALLVGINNYPAPAELKGCMNDVELQKMLLMHRFGFLEDDILELTDFSDIEPTRENILQAFQTHLIEQAKPGDVVVFHFSGHGSMVKDPNPIRVRNESGAEVIYEHNGTLVPKDFNAISQTDSEVVVPDIMGRSLFLMMNAIDTDNLTVILDSCHSGGGTRGNVVTRAAPRPLLRSGSSYVGSPEEFEFQQRLLAGKMTMEEFQQRRQRGIAKGVAIGSALRDQLAIDDNPFGNYHGGTFTYLLTRYLWQASGEPSAAAVENALLLSTRSRAESVGGDQAPDFYYMPEANQQRPIYFVGGTGRSAEAVITNITGDQIQFWLGGVSSRSLASGSIAGAVFTVFDQSGQAIGEIEQVNRTDLYGTGKLITGQLEALQEGQFLRERVRNIPADLAVNVGLDASLEGELEAAQAALQSVGRVRVLAPGEAGAEYLLGRFTETYQQRSPADGAATSPALGSIGLFTYDGNPLSSAHFTPVGDPVNRAIARLVPQFKTLLARKILGLVQTGESSALPVTVKILAMDAQTQATSVVAEVSSRGAQEAGLATNTAPSAPQFLSGSTLKVEVTNGDERDLYVSILVIAADGAMVPLYPANFIDAEEFPRIPRKQPDRPPEPVVLPRVGDETNFVVRGSFGFPEILVLVSTEPLYEALKAMETIARGRNLSRGQILALRGDESNSIVDLLLGDLTNLTRSVRSGAGDGTIVSEAADAQVDTSAVAALSATIQVIPNSA